MLRRTSKYTLVLFMILCIFITSCSKTINSNQKSISSKEKDTNRISNDLEYLCSDECGGRQSGTEGNIKAGNYISNQFKKMAIAPLNSDYQIPYKKQVASIDKISLKLIDTGKKVHSFIYGKDYVEMFLDNANITLPLCNKPMNTDCIILTDNIKNISQYKNDKHIKMIIIKSLEKYSKPSEFYNRENTPQIKVTDEAFSILEHNIGKTIQFSANINVQEKEHYNIAGVIKGESHESAFLISAHFDHIGSIGKPGSRDYIIWRGALDNASGVSTMLETARCLNNIYKDKKPPCDIIFCAFNGEENTLTRSGSSYFLDYIKDKYSSVFDINMDCLGNNDSSTLFIEVNKTTNSKEASEKIINSLREQNTNVEFYNGDYMSDHRTFPHALCITTIPNLSKSNIHSLEDTPDKINITFLSEIAKKTANSIRDNINIIGIDKMKLEKTSDNIVTTSIEATNITTPTDFEKRFNCKLNFLDSKEKCINIDTTSRIDIFKPTESAKTSPAPKNISDIRYISFFMTDYVVSFTTYKTRDTKEMQLYKQENKVNETDNKSKAQKINIGKYTYYIFTKKDNSKIITIEFNTKNILIEASILSSNINEFTSPKQYQDFFKKTHLENSINGMVKLLKERD